MYKIAAIGDKDSVYGFASLGLEVFSEEDPKKTELLIDRLAKNNFGIIYITEEVAAKVLDTINKYKFESKPAIILIPGVKGNTGEAGKELNKTVEKAIGSNILK